ncbi:hypothetical protein CHU95_10220 [Niveispirillum lacus]|uniref:DUF4189 domain-containing protein n=1 Tax=Niveispirillum lacus TaxID=1981099 RepID=A0A255Z0C5_9PROT|nr:hypothetical protein [Niveispirillum lacus]OYQ34943.1 hypothetical protein CHU95_10220 [Niveispirillum lacus]
MSTIRFVLATTAAIIAFPLLAQAAKPEQGLRSLSGVGQEAIAMYDKLQGPKALALADDGAVGYASGVDHGEARIAALARCAEVTRETCRIISVDGQAVAGGTMLGELARSHTDAPDLKGEVVADYEKAIGAKALAWSAEGGFGWVVRDTEEQARTDALAQCETHGTQCAIQASSPGPSGQ